MIGSIGSVVISDTTPLIALAKIGHFDLLEKLFGRVIVSEAVFAELTQHGADRPGAQEIQRVDWIEIRTVIDQPKVHLLLSDLNAGEAESIVLAQEIGADRLLLDERKGRLVAQRMGLPVIGTVGLLILGKQFGYLTELRPLLERLRQADFRISLKLLADALEAVGE